MSKYVYVLEMTPKLAHARYYIGTTSSVPDRVKMHIDGRGAKIIRAAVASGRKVTVAYVCLGGYELERRLKRFHDNARALTWLKNRHEQYPACGVQLTRANFVLR